jgi:hypothetical protein
MATQDTVPTMQSNTKKWAIFGPAAIAILQAIKLIPGVPPSFHPWLDRACELIGLVTGSGVAIGLRDAASKNGTGR